MDISRRKSDFSLIADLMQMLLWRACAGMALTPEGGVTDVPQRRGNHMPGQTCPEEHAIFGDAGYVDQGCTHCIGGEPGRAA